MVFLEKVKFSGKELVLSSSIQQTVHKKINTYFVFWNIIYFLFLWKAAKGYLKLKISLKNYKIRVLISPRVMKLA